MKLTKGVKVNKWIGRSMCIVLVFIMAAYFLRAWPIPYMRLRVGSQDIVINRFTGQVQYHDAPVQPAPQPVKVVKTILPKSDIDSLDFTWASDDSPKVQLDVYNKSSHDIEGYCLFHVAVRDIRGVLKGDRELECPVNVGAHTVQHGIEVDTGINFDASRDAFAWNVESASGETIFSVNDDYTQIKVKGIRTPFYFTLNTNKNRIVSLLSEIPEVASAMQQAEVAWESRRHRREAAVSMRKSASASRPEAASEPKAGEGNEDTSRTISIGSTQAHVKAVMGPPTSMTGEGDSAWWWYGTDRIVFDGGRVASYDNDGGHIPIR